MSERGSTSSSVRWGRYDAALLPVLGRAGSFTSTDAAYLAEYLNANQRELGVRRIARVYCRMPDLRGCMRACACVCLCVRCVVCVVLCGVRCVCCACRRRRFCNVDQVTHVTKVIALPGTIDGDMRNSLVQTTFGCVLRGTSQ